MDEIDAFVSFYESWRQTGIGDDGLPLFEAVVMCRKAKPPLLQIEEIAEDWEIEQFADAYKLFSKTRAVRDLTVKGYPLVLWPAVAPFELKLLAVRDIYTVEQLALLADTKRDTRIPAPVYELAQRAKKLLAMQGKVGKFEAIIHELTAQRDQLQAEVFEARATISAQSSMLNNLQARQSPLQAA